MDNLISNPAQNGKDKQITGHEVCSSVSSRHFLTSLAPKTCCRTQLTTALFRNDSDDRDDYMRTSLRSGVPIVRVVSKILSKRLGRLGRPGRLYENRGPSQTTANKDLQGKDNWQKTFRTLAIFTISLCKSKR